MPVVCVCVCVCVLGLCGVFVFVYMFGLLFGYAIHVLRVRHKCVHTCLAFAVMHSNLTLIALFPPMHRGVWCIATLF